MTTTILVALAFLAGLAAPELLAKVLSTEARINRLRKLIREP
jgi:hypothetical protein